MGKDASKVKLFLVKEILMIIANNKTKPPL